MDIGSIFVDSILEKNSSCPITLHSGSGIEDSTGENAIVTQGDATLVVARLKGKYLSALTEKDNATLCDNFLAVQTPDNRVVLVPMKSCKLKPVNKAKIETAEKDDVVWSVATKKLADEFGSKKLKRIVNMREKWRNETSVNEEAVSAVVADADITIADLDVDLDLESSIQIILPPCDRNAATPELVYPIDSIISPLELNSLESSATYMMENPPTEADAKVSFFITYYFKLFGNKLTLKKMVLMLYIDSLFTFLCTKGKYCPKGVTYCPYSEVVNSKIVQEFTERRVRTTKMDNKGICYTLILIFHLCDMLLDLGTVSTCFKGFTADRLRKLLRVIGARKSLKNKSLYKLSLPLPDLPKPAKMKKVGRK